jgi:hypothetical protein
MVTRISTDLPIMNWLFVDADTHQLRYGVRKDAEGNITGPFDCTATNRRITLQGWKGWCVAEEQPGVWAVYFDIHDNALQGKVAHGTRVLEIEIERREERWKKSDHAIATDTPPKPAAPAQAHSTDLDAAALAEAQPPMDTPPDVARIPVASTPPVVQPSSPPVPPPRYPSIHPSITGTPMATGISLPTPALVPDPVPCIGNRDMSVSKDEEQHEAQWFRERADPPRTVSL